MNRRPPQSSPTRERTGRTRPLHRSLVNRNRKKPDFLRLARYLVVLALIGQCLRVAFTSPRMRLHEVNVTGTKRLTPQQVTRLGRLKLGENIFHVNIASVSKRLQAVPVIEEAIVTRELPSGLNVEVHERVPALAVTADGVSLDADRSGVVFQRSTSASARLPVLEMASGQLPPIGHRLPSGLVSALWDCARLARGENVGLRKMRVDGSGELWLNVATHATGPDGLEQLLDVRVGRWTDLPAKFRDIHQVLAGWPDLNGRAAYLNVMCAGRPAYLRAAADAIGHQKKLEN